MKGFSGDGVLATISRLSYPVNVDYDPNTGDLYIVDKNNFRIRKVSGSSGIISTIIGTGTAGFYGDGDLATAARISSSASTVAFNPYNGLVYIADAGNYRIRVVSATTGVITTIAGNGVSGFSGDGAPAVFSELNTIDSLSINPLNGDMYVADKNNRRIRKLSLIICSPGFYGHSCSLFNCSNLNSCNSHGTCISPQNCSCSPEWTSQKDCSVNDAGVKASDIRTAGSIENGKMDVQLLF